ETMNKASDEVVDSAPQSGPSHGPSFLFAADTSRVGRARRRAEGRHDIQFKPVPDLLEYLLFWARRSATPAINVNLRATILADGGHSVGVAWVDYDHDDYLDLLVTNASGTTNLLYHNERNGNFQRIAEGPIVNIPGDFRAPAFGDYDNDGQIDLYVASTGFYGG